MKQRDIILALGGGGARGIAHVGVIRALENAGYRIRGIAGTSIGSIIGGLYCAGQLSQYEEFLDQLDIGRFARLLDLRIPTRGLMGGHRIETLLRQISGSKKIEELNTPFISVATELTAGLEVRITNGDLAQAMHASYAIPGFFTPVLMDGQWLVDGGVSTPVPVLAARSIDNYPVLAVNVNSSGQSAVNKAFEALAPSSDSDTAKDPKLLTTLSDSIAHLQFHLANFQLKAHPADYALIPALRGVGLFDFQRSDELIEAGRYVTEAALHSGDLQLAIDDAAHRIAMDN